MEEYIQPSKEQFHVVSNNIEEYFTSETEALHFAKYLYKENGYVRVYHQTEWDTSDGVFLDSDCILSKGAFPC